MVEAINVANEKESGVEIYLTVLTTMSLLEIIIPYSIKGPDNGIAGELDTSPFGVL